MTTKEAISATEAIERIKKIASNDELDQPSRLTLIRMTLEQDIVA